MLSRNPGARRWQIAAVVLLLASVAALVAALRANSRAQLSVGPSALLATDTGEVWIGIDDRLWRASRDGALQHDEPLAAMGLPRAPANLVQAPGGRIVATVRDDPVLYVLDPASAKVVDRIQPQWPADLAMHGGRAINLAFHADGRFAVATGAGHFVALFDAKGGYLGRTAPGTYRYSNGLWWIGDALWTTDTNRFQLKRLDAANLAVAETLTLPGDAAARFLGPARRHPRADGPLAALVRYQNGMTAGRVVVVSRDGRETALEHATFEPRDVEWLGNDVIATDGVTRHVLRWAADGTERSPFGDAELNQRFAISAGERDTALRQDRLLRILAGGLFLAALGCALRASLIERVVRNSQVPLDLSRLGTPPLEGAELVRRQAEVYGAWTWTVLPLLAFQTGNGVGLLHAWLGPAGAVAALVAVIVLATFGWWLTFRRHQRLARDPRYERVFNHYAMTRLAGEDALRTSLREGELVLETFMWLRVPRARWTVLTTERLLQFRNGFGGWKLESALERSRIGGAKAQGERFGIWLVDADPLKGKVAAQTVAARVAQQLTAPSPQTA